MLKKHNLQSITAVIPAKNEENNIERCIQSVLWCDKVLVISTGTDKTEEIAKKLGAQVVIKNKSNEDDFEEVQKNFNWFENIICFVRRFPYQIIKEPKAIKYILKGFIYGKQTNR